MKVYYSIPTARVKKVVSCGLNIKDFAEDEVMIGGRGSKCIFASLVPSDIKFNSHTHSIIALEVDTALTYVAEGAYRGAFSVPGETDGDTVSTLKLKYKDLYSESMILLENYRLGSYAKPECPITVSLLPGMVAEYDSRRDTPVMYQNSESFYEERAFESFCERYGNIRFYALRCCCESLCKRGLMKKIRVGTDLVFIDLKTNEKIVIPGN